MVVSVCEASYMGKDRKYYSRSMHHACQDTAERVTEHDTQA